MPNVRTFAVLSMLCVTPWLPAFAQPTGTPASPSSGASPPQPDTTPPPSGNAPPITPPTTPGVVATTNNPNLAVANVKLENGARVSKIIGLSVYTDSNEKVGTVDDVVLTEGDKATVAVISVGGFLGIGSKLVAIPFDQLKRDADKATLPGATKDSLNAMPGLVY